MWNRICLSSFKCVYSVIYTTVKLYVPSNRQQQQTAVPLYLPMGQFPANLIKALNLGTQL